MNAPDISLQTRKELLPSLLLSWYKENKRDLPWRKTFLPYHIWISEVMLQQTQMSRGVDYFTRWIHRFPTIADIAKASLEEIYKYWEGLGYYSRARNLHITAKRIVEEYNGIIPDDVTILNSLQGIGPYTARAIASIAYNKDVPVMDANVIRILSRIFGITKDTSLQQTQREIYSLAEDMLPHGQARDFNQAMMELGALLCAKQTKCNSCPCTTLCYAYQYDAIDTLPYTKPKKEISQYTTMAVILIHENQVLIRQRPSTGLWANLWEFPEYIFTPSPLTQNQQHSLFTNKKAQPSVPIIPQPYEVAQAFYDEYRIPIAVYDSYMLTKYTFTTNKVTLYAYYASLLESHSDVHSLYTPSQPYRFCTKEELSKYTLPSGHNTVRQDFLNKIL